MTPNVTDERHRHRDARDQRRAAVAQEQEHDQHDQRHRQGERAAGVAQRRANRRGALHHHARDRSRSGIDARSVGTSSSHAIDGLDDVGVRLPADDHEHRRLAVGRPRVAQVLHGVDDFRDVGEPDRGAVAVGDDQRQVLAGGLRLVVGVDLPVARAVLDRRLSGDWRWRTRAPCARPRSRCRTCRAPAG